MHIVMEQQDLVLTFDIGTQSVRVSLFNELGDMVSYSKVEYEEPYFSLKPGYAEQHPSYYFECLEKACSDLASKCKDKLPLIKGIMLTCFRDTAVLLDKKLEVIRPSILWLDQRYAKCEDKLPLKSRFLFSLVGKKQTIELNRRRTVSNWIIENEPENWAKVDKYVALSTYLIYRICGNLTDSASDFTGHYPINYKKRDWYANPSTHLQGSIFNISKDKLCKLSKPIEKLGCVTEIAAKTLHIPAGIPIFAGGSDKSCETLGTGVIDTKMLSISLGTACTVETATEKYVEPIRFLPAYPSVLPNMFNMDLQVYRGFWMINWFRKEFNSDLDNDMMSNEFDLKELDSNLEKIPPGSNGLITQPYWGSELDKPEVVGAIIGFNDSTTKYHIYKSIIEGILFELKFGSDSFAKQLGGNKFEKIRIAGGGSGSEAVCQIVADIFGLPVERVQTHETSSLGAATACFLALNKFATKEEAVEKMIHVSDVFTPNKENHKVYMQYFKDVYLKLYPNLKNQYKYLFRKNH